MLRRIPNGSLVLDAPERLTDVPSWHEHIPFAFWCLEALRPRTFVELGTHRGDSYCAFCQGVVRLGLSTRCYAVDTWKGDPHAGYYGEDVYQELRRHHDERYARFSTLVRCTFDEAVSSFPDGSIDLLHVDGLHTREAVQHDFETWLPKLSRAAVVLFHDTAVRAPGFGVWKFWEEVSARYRHFSFLHGHGLGVLLVGDEPPRAARRLAGTTIEERDRIRALFALLGRAVATREAGTARALAALRAWEAQAAPRRSLGGRIAHAGEVALQLLVWTATFRLVRGLRQRKYARLIRRSGLFDSRHYLAQLPDPEVARRDPAWHYVVRGAGEGREPNAFFDTPWYTKRHPDAAAPGKNPLVHFIRGGPRAGRSPGPRFDASFYLAQYPEVGATGRNPLAYHLSQGAAEGRFCTPSEMLEDPAYARAQSDELVERVATLVPDDGPGRVLVVDQWILTPDRDSGSVRMLAILKLLRDLGHGVTFMSASDESRPHHAEDIRRLGIEVVQGDIAARAHLAAEGHRYRFVVLSRPEVCHRFLPFVRAHAFHAAVIYDTVDLHWVRLRRAADLSGDPGLQEEWKRFRVIERLCARSADLVLAITPEERETLRAECPSARIEVLPNIHRCVPSSRPWGERDGLLFVGSYDHAPNVDAVEWFVGEILPRVRRAIPGVVLRVVGSNPPPRLAALASPAVEVVGWVPDLDPSLERARLFVAPLRWGAGMKGKVGQAMSHGLPLVTTSIGAEGTSLVDGEHALVADDADSFAAAVVRLYQDELLWTRLAQGSVSHIQQHFSEEATRTRLAALLTRSPEDGAAAPEHAAS